MPLCVRVGDDAKVTGLTGAAFLVGGFIYSRDMEDTSPPVQLLNKLKRLDPDFLDKLEAELPIGPEPEAELAQAVVEPSAPPLELLSPGSEAELPIGPKADPARNRPNSR